MIVGRPLAIAALLALVMTGCAAGDQRATPTPSPTPTATPTGETMDATIFYMLESQGRFYVAPEAHEIDAATSARARLEEMLRGDQIDPDLFSPWPADAQIIDITLQSGTAIVNWSADALQADAGAQIERVAIQQAVWTLTEIDGIDRVEFIVEGKTNGTASNGLVIEDWWGHVGLSEQPFTRDDDVLVPITITSPDEGAEISDDVFRVSGEATVFEANVIIRLRDDAGEVVKRTFTTASIGAPDRGTWSRRLRTPEEPGLYTIEAVEEDQRDGGDAFVMTRRIRVTG